MSRIRTTVTAGPEPEIEPAEPAPVATRKQPSKPDAAKADVADPIEETP